MVVVMVSVIVVRGYYKWRRKLKYRKRDYTMEYTAVNGSPATMEEWRPTKSKSYMNGHLPKHLSRDSLDLEVEKLMRKRLKKDKVSNGHLGIPLVGLAKVGKDQSKNKTLNSKSKMDTNKKKKRVEKGKLDKQSSNGLNKQDFLKEVRFNNMRRDAAQRYAEKMCHYRDGRNGLMISRMAPYFYDRHGDRMHTQNMFRNAQQARFRNAQQPRNRRHDILQGHGDIVRVPRPVYRSLPHHSQSVPDMPGYVNSIPRSKYPYPLNPQIHVVSHHDNKRHLRHSSADLATSRHRYRSLGNLHPRDRGRGHTRYQSEIDVYRHKDALFLPARYDDVKFHTISAKPRSSRSQFGSRSEWI